MRDTTRLLMLRPEKSERIDYTGDTHPTEVLWKSSRDSVELNENATHFVFCAEGNILVRKGQKTRELEENGYACVWGPVIIEGDGAALISSRIGFKGLESYGGELEKLGRLMYIDGCSSTVLVSPPRKGDPCFNFLHVPKGTDQTPHTHPTLRVGYIIEGNGIIKLEASSHPLKEKTFFCLPADMVHSFHTDEEDLRIVIYHPDSEVGPSDEAHPMLNRTIVGGVPAHISLR